MCCVEVYQVQINIFVQPCKFLIWPQDQHTSAVQTSSNVHSLPYITLALGSYPCVATGKRIMNKFISGGDDYSFLNILDTQQAISSRDEIRLLEHIVKVATIPKGTNEFVVEEFRSISIQSLAIHSYILMHSQHFFSVIQYYFLIYNDFLKYSIHFK